MKRISIILTFFFLPVLIFCQTITWSKVYGTNTYTESASTIKQTQEGGFIVVGKKYSSPSSHIWIIRLDESGDSLWSKTYQNIGEVLNLDMEYGIDSGFIFYGSIQINPDSFMYSLILLWTDNAGDTIMSTQYKISDDPDFVIDSPSDIDVTNDSCFVIVGQYYIGNEHGFLLKINKNGDSLWTSIPVEERSFLSVVQTGDESFIATMNIMLYEQTLIKIDSIGNPIAYCNSLGGNKVDIEMLSDSNFVFIQSQSGPYAIVKITEDLDTIWTRSGTGYLDVAPCNDGGFVVTGSSGGDLFLTKYDTDGNLLWTVSYGGNGSEGGNYVEQTQDGGYILCGWTDSYGSGNRDFYIIKTDSAGHAVGVEENINSWVDFHNYSIDYSQKGTVKILFTGDNLQGLHLKFFDTSGREVFLNESYIYQDKKAECIITNSPRGVYFFRTENFLVNFEGKLTFF
ncbi:MAG: hypothetical protein JW870_13660 [Candidatus Delongbacteria bacterium]|nr:hypothetical protein [Candidatus Delongbacteria bacterium]